MSRKISPFRYTAENNAKGTLALLKEYNVPPQAYSDEKKATNALKKLSILHKTDTTFIKKMLDIHPDAKLFKNQTLEMIEESKKANIDEYKSMDAIDSHYEYADNTTKIVDQSSHITTKNALIGVGIGIGFTIALVGLVKMLQTK